MSNVLLLLNKAPADFWRNESHKLNMLLQLMCLVQQVVGNLVMMMSSLVGSGLADCH